MFYYRGCSAFIELLEAGKGLSLIPTTEIIMEPMDKFKNLIKQDRLFVFLEGTDSEPRSKKSIELVTFLVLNKMKYKYYNIELDPEVKKAAMEYSGWWDFPQVYFEEQLIGDWTIAELVLPTLEI